MIFSSKDLEYLAKKYNFEYEYSKKLKEIQINIPKSYSILDDDYRFVVYYLKDDYCECMNKFRFIYSTDESDTIGLKTVSMQKVDTLSEIEQNIKSFVALNEIFSSVPRVHKEKVKLALMKEDF